MVLAMKKAKAKAKAQAKAKAPMRKTPMRKVKKAAPKKTGSKTKKQASMRKAAMRRVTTLVDHSANPFVVSLQERVGQLHGDVWVPLFASPAQNRAYNNEDLEPCPDGDDCDDPDCEGPHPSDHVML